MVMETKAEQYCPPRRFTDKQVKKIKRLHKGGKKFGGMTLRDLAAMFTSSTATMGKVVHGHYPYDTE